MLALNSNHWLYATSLVASLVLASPANAAPQGAEASVDEANVVARYKARLEALDKAYAIAPSADRKRIDAERTLLRHNLAHWHRVQAAATSATTTPALDSALLDNEFLVQALRHPYTKGNFSWQVLAGAEMSNRDASFSSVNGYARFIGDTAFYPESQQRCAPKNVHGIVDLSFSTIPVQGSTSTFVESEKALTGAVGLDWLFAQTKQSADGYRIQGGPAVRVGVQSIDGQLDDLGAGGGSGQEFWGVGLTIRTAPAFRYSDRNPMPYAYLTLLWGEYDTLSGHAFTADGVIRFVPDQASELKSKDPWGLFIGLRAVVNEEGDDDLRFQAGVQDGLALLKDLFESTTTLFGDSKD